MHICFITPEFVTEKNEFDGGLSNYLLRVSLALTQSGHAATIVVKSDEEGSFTYRGIEVHRVKMPEDILHRLSPPLQWLYESYCLNLRVKEIVQTTQIDILQYTSYRATALYRIQTLPSVARISSYQPLLNAYYDRPETTYSANCNTLEMLALKNTDRIFGPSKFIADIVTQDTHLKVEVIESPFVNDVQKLDYQHYRKHFQGKTYLLFFGSLGILKGVVSIADMLKKLFDKHPHLYFAFIGKDNGYKDQKMLEYVYEKAGDYKERVLYMNKIPHSELYPIIMNSYAVILPSRIDNFPNACIEAMALRKIVVGTHHTGFEQLITHEKNGFLCSKDDSENLLHAIEEVFSLTPECKQNIEQRAYERILHLAPEKVVPKLINYYDSVIQAFNQKDAYEKTGTHEAFIHQLLYEELRKKDMLTQCLSNSLSYRIGKLITSPLSALLKRRTSTSDI